jgi:hypothetical protein
MKALLASTAVALVACLATASAQAASSDYGLESVNASLSTLHAGAHPDFTIGFALKTDPASALGPTGLHKPYAFTRDIKIGLPPGLVGNPHAVGQCTPQQFATALEQGGGCPQASQIGISKVAIYQGATPFTEPVFNMIPPPGAPAELGLYGGQLKTLVTIGVRSESDYGLNSVIEGLPTFEQVVSAQTTIWGVPASPAHDTERLTVLEAFQGAAHSPPRESGLSAELPFLQNPVHCGEEQDVFVETDSYQEPGLFSRLDSSLPALSGCGAISFAPEFSATPTTREAASPSGLNVDLRIPQDETLSGRATGQLRGATVTFPQGMTLAAGAAEGLQACSEAQVGYGVSPPPPSNCPAASKLGTAEFDVPQLPRTIEGAIYQRTPTSGDLFRVWLVSDELGVYVKIPGDIHLDPVTGQVTSIFVGTPQVPVRELKLHIFGGPRGPFATPSSCGTYQTHYEFTPWSGTPPVVGDAPMTIDQNCATGGFRPTMSAGAENPTAGAFSPFILRIDRQPTEQNLQGLELTLPQGVLAKLNGVALCPEVQAAIGNCPATSQVGSAKVASGPGPSPLWLPQAGREPISLFLSGPYKGAPYSLVVRAPAQAGPFDLGTVVVRQALFINPETAQVTVKSDPLPQILEGVPITYRTIYASIDRPQFTINPTSCEPKSVQAALRSSGGAVASVSSRLQVGSCSSLAFKPNLKLTFSGQTKRLGFPALKAVLTQPAGRNANIAKTSVILPKGEFIANAHISNPCTRVQFNAGVCPKASILGTAKAWSPLLERPLEGPVYFRSNGGERELPDIVADLNGQIHIVLVGFIDSVGKKGSEVRRTRTRFQTVPDAPVSRFELKLAGGKRGLLENTKDLCKTTDRAAFKLTGQNGKAYDTEPKVQVSCGKGRKK